MQQSSSWDVLARSPILELSAPVKNTRHWKASDMNSVLVLHRYKRPKSVMETIRLESLLWNKADFVEDQSVTDGDSGRIKSLDMHGINPRSPKGRGTFG